MDNKTCILVCNYFAKEVEAVLQSQNLQNVFVKIFPGNCGRPPLAKGEIPKLMAPENCVQHCILGSACLKEIKNDLDDNPNLCHFNTCFEMVLNKNLVNHYINNGAYLVSPGWLNNWEKEIENWGFNKKTASEFFGETCQRILLLDTGINADSSTQLKAFSAFLNLPSESIPVGIDYLELYLSKTLIQLNDSNKKLGIERKITDYSMTMDLLNDLAESLNEKEVINKIIQLFTLLFAPAKLYYLPVVKQKSGILIANPEIENTTPIIKELLNNKGEEIVIAWKNGFQCQLIHKEELLGIIKIDVIAFPQYLEHYQNLATSVLQICALVVSNARAYQFITNQKNQLFNTLEELKETQDLLIESEKMASLGNLVAGVAHEINTPVGIGITAASGVLNKLSKLEALFNSNELTKSNFEKALESMKLAGELIFKNLQRTSQLISSFKLISVDKASERIREFKLKSYLNDIIFSLEPELRNKNVKVKMNCADNILLNSYPGALAQVVTNLIMNSIKHAFKTVPDAVISISAQLLGESIQISYSDNGIGISEENLPKIFDPFFTTDKQGGSGLGLHIVYNIIKQKLKGTITCESKSGNGVVFNIKFPAKLAEEQNQ